MYLAVRQSLLLVMPMAKERLLALRTNKMLQVTLINFPPKTKPHPFYLNMPMLPQRSDNALLDGPSAGSADRNPHLVMATEAVKFVHVIRRKPGPASHLPSISVQLDSTSGAVEVVRVVHFTSELQGLVVDDAAVKGQN